MAIKRDCASFWHSPFWAVCIFLGLQAYEWTHLIFGEGMSIRHPPHNFPNATTLFGATFFILTGFHGMHVTGGVIYLACLLIRLMTGAYSADLRLSS